MRKYIKPSIDLYAVSMQHLMAGSDIRSYNQITDKENIWVSGYSLPSTSTGDTNGNVDDMSKSNSLDMWDDEEE